MADPDFGRPGPIDLLLGVDVFLDALLTGRRIGQHGTPSAFETHFGWVLAGSVEGNTVTVPSHIASYHISLSSGDDILQRFWEIEDSPLAEINLSPEERAVVQHFDENHRRTSSDRFVVPLTKKNNDRPIGESRSQAVRRFLSLDRTLRAQNQFGDFSEVINEYLKLGHAELSPT